MRGDTRGIDNMQSFLIARYAYPLTRSLRLRSQLSASKKIVNQLSGKEDNIANSKLAANDIKGAIAEKNAALKEIYAKVRTVGWRSDVALFVFNSQHFAHIPYTPSAYCRSTNRRSCLTALRRRRTPTEARSPTS